MTTYKIENPFITQLRVIMALVLRETRVTFGNSQLGYLWAILRPAFSTMLMVLIFSTISRHPPIGTNFAIFFALGLIPFEMQRKLSSSLMGVFTANKGLLTYPLVKETDVVYARFLLVTATYLLVMILFYGTLILFFNVHYPAHIEQMLMVVGVASLLGLGGGLTNAVLMRLWPTWKQLEAILARPLFFISGIFFIPSAFSPAVRDFLYWNPLIHMVEWMREGYYPSYQSVLLDKGYLLTITSLLLLFGLAGERLYRKKMN